ncbi:tyrosine-protein kinase ABL1-like [Punica granatum]|uniref:Protein kinase domain-containing protein n=2 Tax=Punica granatum TaxID=22663 RepID=A0A218W904_PUNGR|nr:tyrosine-protein kinase ABL1-like [Punica granatum]OWM68681.1 hypothetical protein CDL15_Pgr023646 [Punica granatum]PKI76622.1 hypothetical protein CRG98_002931 [Punica granatum]
MEQFRQIGEALGSLKALMVFCEDIQINLRQCTLLVDMLSSAYEVVAEEMKHNLRFEEKQVKWRILEQPLKELLRVFKEAELYVRSCLETKDWWARAIALYQNADCVELHIHNLLCCMPIVIEAIEIAGEMAGWDHDEMQKKRLVYTRKYQKEWKDPKLFQWKYGKQYLITPEFCRLLEAVWKEDRWILLNKVREKSHSGPTTKQEQRLNDLLSRNLDISEPSNWKLLPSSVLLGSKDYQVRRRLGCGGGHKEILWLGESFAMRHIIGNIEPLAPEISTLHSLSHPNIMHLLCSFMDEEKKECFLIMELMNRDLGSYIKEICGPRKRIPFSLPVALDLMLQIARGMEYLHHKKMYHGDLTPCNILVKARGNSSEGYLHAKVSGFGLSQVKSSHQKSPLTHSASLPFIWHAPEVLAEGEEAGGPGHSKYNEKSDVYSYAMICFELLTGKTPFEDAHLQGDKMSRNIRAGERPLFPFHCPKYLINLTKRCWHTDQTQRPSFSSICRILRYVKRFLAMNPEHSIQSDPPMPLVDYSDIESRLLRKFPSWDGPNLLPVSEIPFQMFVYRVVEREKVCASLKGDSESGSDSASVGGDENMLTGDDPFLSMAERKLSISPEPPNKNLLLLKRSPDAKTGKQPGTPRGRLLRPPQITSGSRTMRMNSEGQLLTMSPKIRRSSSSGHASDSELP